MNWSEPDTRWFAAGVKGRYTIYLMPETGNYALFLNAFDGERFGPLRHLGDTAGLEGAKKLAAVYDVG